MNLHPYKLCANRGRVKVVTRARNGKGLDAWPAALVSGTNRYELDHALAAAFGDGITIEEIETERGTRVLIVHGLGDPREWDSASRFLWSEVVHGKMPARCEGVGGGVDGLVRTRLTSPAVMDV